MTWVLKNGSEFAGERKREKPFPSRSVPKVSRQKKSPAQIPVDLPPPNGFVKFISNLPHINDVLKDLNDRLRFGLYLEGLGKRGF